MTCEICERPLFVNEALQLNNCRFFHPPRPDRITERATQLRAIDFHDVAVYEHNTIGKAQGCGAKNMHMHLPRLAEERIFEVVVFEIR